MSRQSTATFTYYNRNPKGLKSSADCVIRAISGATGQSWASVLKGLTEVALEVFDTQSAKRTFSEYLKRQGWSKQSMPRKSNNKRYTVREFQREHPKGTFILSVANHLTFIEDGILYDTWNCQYKSVGNYWTDDSADYSNGTGYARNLSEDLAKHAKRRKVRIG